MVDEYPKLQGEFRTFSKGQPGHDYIVQYLHFQAALSSIRDVLVDKSKFEDIVPSEFSKAQAAIDAIPIPPTSVILEAGSPFTAYCRLHELCEIDATISLVWLDPYLDASIFHRYLASVRPHVYVTLVACEPSPNANKRDKARWSEFLDLSRFYAQERGASAYRLIQQTSLHDRWVVFDDKRIYNLGGSAKDAGSRDYFTITPIDPSDTNLRIIQKLTTSGIELFGPTTPVHV